MGKDSGIQWTDHTFNPWRGCVKVSPACQHCYAETLSKMRGKQIWGKDAPREFAAERYWRDPLKWDAAAKAAGVRARVFCSSLADVCEDRPDLVEPRQRLMRLIRVTQNLDWLLLTKRPGAFTRLFDWERHDHRFAGAWPRNIWVGTTAENQEWADARIPSLLEVPAAVRFVSVEPMLGPVDLSRYLLDIYHEGVMACRGVHWVIVGGESGAGARPMNPAWARAVREQCKAAGAAFHFKQWGEWSPEAYGEDGRTSTATFGSSVGAGYTMFRHGKKASGRTLDGREWDQFPVKQ